MFIWFGTSNSDWIKKITWFISSNHSCCLQKQMMIELQVERLYWQNSKWISVRFISVSLSYSRFHNNESIANMMPFTGCCNLKYLRFYSILKFDRNRLGSIPLSFLLLYLFLLPTDSSSDFLQLSNRASSMKLFMLLPNNIHQGFLFFLIIKHPPHGRNSLCFSLKLWGVLAFRVLSSTNYYSINL